MKSNERGRRRNGKIKLSVGATFNKRRTVDVKLLPIGIGELSKVVVIGGVP